MASTRIIEQDHGTYAGHITNQHNGYYAGDFRRPQQRIAPALATTDRNVATASDARGR